MSGQDAPIRAGNTLPIRNIPIGATIHCIEMMPGKGAQLARSAGTSAVLLARDGSYAQVRLRSGEVRRVHIDCRAFLCPVRLGAPEARHNPGAHAFAEPWLACPQLSAHPRFAAGGARRGRSLWRRGAEIRGRRAQRASSSCLPKLFERRERSEHSEFFGTTPGRAPQRSWRQAPTATV